MRSFGQLMQLFEKKKQKPEEEGETEQPEAGGVVSQCGSTGQTVVKPRPVVPAGA